MIRYEKEAHQATVLGSLFQLLTLMPWEKVMPDRSDHTGIPRSHFSLAHTQFASVSPWLGLTTLAIGLSFLGEMKHFDHLTDLEAGGVCPTQILLLHTAKKCNRNLWAQARKGHCAGRGWGVSYQSDLQLHWLPQLCP